MTGEALLKKIRDHGAVVVGAGYLAGVFAKMLQEKGLRERLYGFYTTGGSTEPFFGLPVRRIAQLPGDLAAFPSRPAVCLAVHRAVAPELEQALVKAGVTGAVFAAPLLQELIYGQDLVRAELPLRLILEHQPEENYWITLRYAALREHLDGGTGAAASVYQKAQAAFSTPETAAKRLERFFRMAGRIEAEGWNPEPPVLLDRQLRVIDGLHRLAAAACLGIDTVSCRIVAESPLYPELLKEANRLTPEAQGRAGLAAEEQALLREKKAELLENTGAAGAAPAVSVIVPVYNIGAYLDVCLESLLAQTFRDFEILLIDDGSTDDSPGRCRQWAEADGRIRFVRKANGGVSETRNLGIRLARGEYLAFVDPDDWVDPTYLEKLLGAAREAGADFAECDLWRVDNRTGKRIRRICSGRMGLDYTLEEHMKYGPTALYKSVMRRRLWTDHDLELPPCSFESPAVYALLLALSNKIVNVREPLYYYRRFRENSLVETGYADGSGRPDPELGTGAMRFLIGSFRRLGLYERYRGTLEGVVTYRLNDILAMQFHRRMPEEFAGLVEKYRSLLEELFPGRRQRKIVTWGGYNLNRILTHLDQLHDPSCRFNFSSLAAIAGEPDDDGGAIPEPEHRNRYRQQMLERERTGAFWRVLEREQPDLLVLDLLEERFDLLETGGRYLTKSDAFAGSSWAGSLSGETLCRFTEDCLVRWKQAADTVFARVRRMVPGIRILVITSLLCSEVGDLTAREPFDEPAAIDCTNRLLRTCYAYLKEILPEAVFADPTEDELYFTDRAYEYGAVPSHLNELENQKIAERIEALL